MYIGGSWWKRRGKGEGDGWHGEKKIGALIFTVYVSWNSDYDALLTEAGDITEKYRIARQIIHEAMEGRQNGSDTVCNAVWYSERLF